MAELGQLAEIVTPAPLRVPTSRDPDDDAVLAAAVTGQADAIVSGDADLLDLRYHEGIPIVTTAEALRRIATAPNSAPERNGIESSL